MIIQKMSRKYFQPYIHEEFLKASLRFFYLTSDCFSPLYISSIFSWKERLYLLYLELPRSHFLRATGTQSSRPTDTSGVSVFTVAHRKFFLTQLSYNVSLLFPPLLPLCCPLTWFTNLCFLLFLLLGQNNHVFSQLTYIHGRLFWPFCFSFLGSF